MKFYLINLDRSPDRLAWMSSRLQTLGINPVRVPAVDGKQLSKETLNRWDSVRHPQFGMGPGEVACFLSHRRVWEIISDGKDDWGLVAEDDIHISDHLVKFMADADWVPEDANIIKAETAKQRVWLSSKSRNIADSHSLRVLRSYHGGSAAYFVNKDTANWMLRETESFCTTVDQLLFNPKFKIAEALKIFQIDPALAAQDWVHDSPSANAALESLLLAERSSFHGVKQAKNKGGLTYIGYKLSNPVVKASRRSIEFAANTFGTHSVKKIAFG
jgi:glycosyl transferase family 25